MEFFLSAQVSDHEASPNKIPKVQFESFSKTEEVVTVVLPLVLKLESLVQVN